MARERHRNMGCVAQPCKCGFAINISILLWTSLTLAFFLNGNSAVAAGNSCAEIPNFFTPDQDSIIRHDSQGQSKLCYAFSMATLIKYELGGSVSQSVGNMALTMGLDLGDEQFFTYDKRRMGIIDLGWACDAFRAFKKRGQCVSGRNQFDFSSYKNKLENVARDCLGSVESTSSVKMLCGKKSCAETEGLVANNSFFRCMSWAIEPACALQTNRSPIISNLACQSGSFANSSEARNEIASKIRAKMPFAVHFCDQLLYSGSSYAGLIQRDRTNVKKTIWQDKCWTHYAIVSGMRFNKTKGSCEVLLRDSNYPRCSSLSREWQCSNNGYVWVGLDSLAENAFEIVSLKREQTRTPPRSIQ